MKKPEFLLLLIIIFNLLLRLPSFWEPTSYGDECIYLSMGQAFNRGLVFYRDIHDNKPPLLYIMAALANGRLANLRLISIGFSSINIWLIYLILKKMLKTSLPAVIGAFFFLLFALLPEGRIANGELFMIMPATLGLFLALKALKEKKAVLWFLTGLCFSAAFLFKVPVVLDFIGLFIAFFIFAPFSQFIRKRNVRYLFAKLLSKDVFLILAGFFIPIALTIIYYGQRNAFTPYVRSALMQNIGYLSSWSGSSYGLFMRALIIIVLTIIIFLWRRKLGFNFCLLSLMTLYGLFGVFLSERPYPHYLIEIAPWSAILITIAAAEKNLRQKIIVLIFIILTLVGVRKYKFWWYSFFPYYQNFINYSLGKINQQQYFSFFGKKTLIDYQLAQLIKKSTSVNDRVYIYGDAACIYAWSERLPVGRYTVNYHIYDFNGFEETYDALQKHKPKIIINFSNEDIVFPKLETYLLKNYGFLKAIGPAKIYLRIIHE